MKSHVTSILVVLAFTTALYSRVGRCMPLAEDLDTLTRLSSSKGIFCTGSTLDQSLKRSRIYIGVVGCEIDTLLGSITKEDIQIAGAEENCAYESREVCPTPEYLVTLLDALKRINQDPQILPHHELCVRPAILPPLPHLSILTSSIYNQIIDQDNVTVVINTFWSEIASFVHALILPYSIPLLTFSEPAVFHDVDLLALKHILVADDLEEVHQTNAFQIDELEQAAGEYFFTMAPASGHVLVMLNEITHKFGWEKVGLIVEDEISIDNSGSFKIYSKFTSYRLVYYQEGKLLALFQPFVEDEILVFIFHGHARVYLRLLYEASRYDFVNNRTTWIYPYFDTIFPENYVNLWCGFMDEEVFVIKNALRGSLLLGMASAAVEKEESFADTFPRKSNGSGSCEQPQFIHTSYIHDIVSVIATALHQLVVTKAAELNVSQEDIKIGKPDRKLLVDQLLLAQVPDGVTGRITFTSSGERDTPLFAIRNFVPIENANFSVDTVLLEDPWVLQTRGEITLWEDGGTVAFQFYTDDGEVSNASTIVFADGTTNIPPFHPFHIFVRGPWSVPISFTLWNLIFVFMFIRIVIQVYYDEQKARELDNTSILKDGDLVFPSGTFSAFKSYNKAGIAKLKKGGIFVQLSPARFNRSMLTKDVHLEIDKLRTTSHTNTAQFHGCFLGNTEVAFLYEHCSRGSLEDIFSNPELELDWVFRLSFALDAAEGMMYLHNKRIIHGRVSTATCIVNEQWTLKLKDYGLRQLHKPMFNSAKKEGDRETKKKYLPPEACFIGDKGTYKTDIYCYGLVLEELAIQAWTSPEDNLRRSILGKSVHQKKDSDCTHQRHMSTVHNNYYEEVITPKVLQVVRKCVTVTPTARPAFDWIANKLRKISHLFQKTGKEDVSMLQIYSRRLEERLEEMGNLMLTERDHSNDVIRSFIPECAMTNGQVLPLKKYQRAVLCLEITNTEYLMANLPIKEFNKIIVLIQRTVEGVITNFKMNQLHTSGSTWIISSVTEVSTKTIEDAVGCAMSIFYNFKDIPIPEHPGVHLTARAGLHTGGIAYGVVQHPIPKLVCFGSSISTATHLQLCSKDGQVLATTRLIEHITEPHNIEARSHMAMEVDNELMNTVWVQISATQMCNLPDCRKERCFQQPQESTIHQLQRSKRVCDRVTTHDRKTTPSTLHKTRPRTSVISPSSINPSIPFPKTSISKYPLFSDHSGNQYLQDKPPSPSVREKDTSSSM